MTCCWLHCGFSLSLLLCALSVWLNGVFLYLRPCIPLCGRWVQAWHSAGVWQGELRSSMGLRPCQSNLQQCCDTVRAWGETCWHSALKRVGQLMSVERTHWLWFVSLLKCVLSYCSVQSIFIIWPAASIYYSCWRFSSISKFMVVEKVQWHFYFRF